MEEGGKYTNNGFFLLRHLFTSGASIPYILESQYYLARKGNISLLDSNSIPEWEREALLGFLMRDLKKEAEKYKNI